MTVCDFSNLVLTGSDSDGARGYDAYVTAFLSYGANLRDFFAVADANPGAPLLQAHAGALHMAFEAADGWDAATPYLERMRAQQRGATERERLFCAAATCWQDKNFYGALAALDELTVRWPADLCAIKWGQYHAFNLGDQAALLRFGQRAHIAHENSPYAHGMIAFALEQNHRLREAEDEGMRATEIAIDDAWAHHAVAHVLETEGRAKEGARWLEHCAHTWERKGVFIREHNWWHVGLFQLALGDTDKALEIFDARLWGEWPEFPQEQIGAVSMLWRLELRGVDVGERWTPIAEQARARVDDHLFPFHDLHYLYALARAGTTQEADLFLDGLTAHCAIDGNKTWADVCLPAAQSVLAFARGQKREAREKLVPLLPDLHRIGGSHAQRHLFHEVVASCERSENFHQHSN